MHHRRPDLAVAAVGAASVAPLGRAVRPATRAGRRGRGSPSGPRAGSTTRAPGASNATSTPSKPWRAELALEQDPERLVQVREHRVERNVYDQRHPNSDPNRAWAPVGKIPGGLRGSAASLAGEDARVRQALRAQPLPELVEERAALSLRVARRSVPRPSISASHSATPRAPRRRGGEGAACSRSNQPLWSASSWPASLWPCGALMCARSDAPVRVDHDLAPRRGPWPPPSSGPSAS